MWIILIFIIFIIFLNRKIIFKYQKKDHTELINLLKTTFHLDYSNIEDILNGIQCYVAKNNNKIIGCVMINIKKDDYSFLFNLAVDEKWKRKGIGKLLHDVCRKEAIANNSRGINLVIKNDNLPSLSFHKKLNYTKIDKELYQLTF